MWNKPIVQVLLILVVLLVIAASFLLYAAQRGWDGLVKEDLGDRARGVIREQLYLLRQGDVALLRATFTEPLRAQVTPQLVAKAQPAFDAVVASTLVGDVAEVEDAAVPTVRITTPEGRLLTRLVRSGDLWLADTLWIR